MPWKARQYDELRRMRQEATKYRRRGHEVEADEASRTLRHRAPPSRSRPAPPAAPSPAPRSPAPWEGWSPEEPAPGGHARAWRGPHEGANGTVESVDPEGRTAVLRLSLRTAEARVRLPLADLEACGPPAPWFPPAPPKPDHPPPPKPGRPRRDETERARERQERKDATDARVLKALQEGPATDVQTAVRAGATLREARASLERLAEAGAATLSRRDRRWALTGPVKSR